MDNRFRRAERQYTAMPSDDNLHTLLREISRSGGVPALNEFLESLLLRWDIPARIVHSKSHRGVFSIPMLWKGKTRGYRSFIINGDGTLGTSPHGRQRRGSLPIPDTLHELISRRINDRFIAWEHNLLVAEINKALKSAAEQWHTVTIVSSDRVPDQWSEPSEPSVYLNNLHHNHEWIMRFHRWEDSYEALDISLLLERISWRDMLTLRINSNIGYRTGHTDHYGFAEGSEVQGGVISGEQYREFGFDEPYEEDEPEDYAAYQEADDFDIIDTLEDIPRLLNQYFAELAELYN